MLKTARLFLLFSMLFAFPAAHAAEVPLAALFRLLRGQFGAETAARLIPTGARTVSGETEVRLLRLIEENCGEVSERALLGLSAARRAELALRVYELLPSPGPLEFLSTGAEARVMSFMSTLSEPAILKGPPESRAVRRAGILLEGGGAHVARLDATGKTLRLQPAHPGRVHYDGIRYLEFPNSTMLQTLDRTSGETRSFLLSRGVRNYVTDIDLASGSISPQGYVSDVLLFEIVSGKAVYRSRLLNSIEATSFFFEDPRISVLHFEDGTRRTFLSGTDYSPHLAGATTPDVMNRYLELTIDGRGLPLPIETGASGIPKFSNLSPFPRARAEGVGLISIDAKNGTIAFNENNQVVVRTRLRPDFSVPEIRALAQGDHWKYGEQVFVFESYEEFTRYDWDHCLEDLFAKGPARARDPRRVKPLVAKVILRDAQLREFFQDSRVLPAKGKGGGPGTPPVRVVRRGENLFVADGKNAPEVLAGKVPRGFPLRDGEVSYLSFDHEIRYFSDVREGQAYLKRHYSLSVKKFNRSLTRIDAYFADALQPKLPHELGYQSGIADLQHVYPMGREVIAGADGLARVRISLGVSDAHTEIAEVDVIALLMEMAPGSARWNAGQVYRP